MRNFHAVFRQELLILQTGIEFMLSQEERSRNQALSYLSIYPSKVFYTVEAVHL
jgi:hypothetical protein